MLSTGCANARLSETMLVHRLGDAAVRARRSLIPDVGGGDGVRDERERGHG